MSVVYKDLFALFISEFKMKRITWISKLCPNQIHPWILLKIPLFLHNYSFIWWNCHGITPKLQDIKVLSKIFHPVCIAKKFRKRPRNSVIRLNSDNNWVWNDVDTGTTHCGGYFILASNFNPCSYSLTLHTSIQVVAMQGHVMGYPHCSL